MRAFKCVKFLNVVYLGLLCAIYLWNYFSKSGDVPRKVLWCVSLFQQKHSLSNVIQSVSLDRDSMIVLTAFTFFYK